MPQKSTQKEPKNQRMRVQVLFRGGFGAPTDVPASGNGGKLPPQVGKGQLRV